MAGKTKKTTTTKTKGANNTSKKKTPFLKKIGKGFSEGLTSETKRTAAAIIFIILAIVFLLSAWEQAGVAGELLYENLEALLGLGFFLLPVIFLLLAIVLLRRQRVAVALPAALGAILFVLSGLGLFTVMISAEAGGSLGAFIAEPLVMLFDGLLAGILLAGVFAISLLFLFDTRPSIDQLFFWRWFRQNESADSDEPTVENAPAASEAAESKDEKALQNDNNTENEKEAAAASGVTEKARGVFTSREKKKDEYEPDLEPQSPRDLDEAYSPPPLKLLTKDKGKPGMGDIKANTNTIKRTLRNFGIIVEMDEVSVGPTVTRYALKPAEGVKLSRITNLQNELALALAAGSVRIEAPIPKTSLVGIEIPNTTKSTIGLGSLLSSKEFTNRPDPLLAAFGKNISGDPSFGDIGKMPHLLIAGTTGSGKSVAVHTLITSLLYRNAPSNMRFIMVDPKRVELTLYNGIPHLLSPVITDPKKAVLALKWLAKEMNRRYDILEQHKVRDISSYHEKVVAKELEKKKDKKTKNDSEADESEDEEEGVERMPYIVVLIDELADIMQSYPKEFESGIVRLAQMSRAVGIHLILSTQRPSVNVITGLIKANIPARVALQVASNVDSRTILDMAGAEKLLGAGDMLYLSGEMARPVRLQSAFISEDEVKSVVDYLKKQSDGTEDEISFSETEGGEKNPDAIFSQSLSDDDEEEDSLYEDARAAVVSAGRASTSYLQRKLRIGYGRAARLVDMLEERGVIGPADGAKPREVYERADEGHGRDEPEPPQDFSAQQTQDDEDESTETSRGL